jgi:hypothetical protein
VFVFFILSLPPPPSPPPFFPFFEIVFWGHWSPYNKSLHLWVSKSTRWFYVLSSNFILSFEVGTRPLLPLHLGIGRLACPESKKSPHGENSLESCKVWPKKTRWIFGFVFWLFFVFAYFGCHFTYYAPASVNQHLPQHLHLLDGGLFEATYV